MQAAAQFFFSNLSLSPSLSNRKMLNAKTNWLINSWPDDICNRLQYAVAAA